MPKLLRISGNSLHPIFQDGDFVLVSKIPYLFGTIVVGDVVAFRHGVHGTMIKIVDSIAPDGHQITVKGTYPGSVDSDTFGPIIKQDIVGKVVWHIGKPLS